MNEQLPYRFVIGLAELVPTHPGSEAKMLTIAACILSGIVVLGFYGYVVAHLSREHRKMKARDQHVADHVSRISTSCETKPLPSPQQSRKKTPSSFRTEALVNVGVALGGLAAMFAEIEILSRLLSSSH